MKYYPPRCNFLQLPVTSCFL